jgi:hypothetical protein
VIAGEAAMTQRPMIKVLADAEEAVSHAHGMA